MPIGNPEPELLEQEVLTSKERREERRANIQMWVGLFGLILTLANTSWLTVNKIDTDRKQEQDKREAQVKQARDRIVVQKVKDAHAFQAGWSFGELDEQAEKAVAARRHLLASRKPLPTQSVMDDFEGACDSLQSIVDTLGVEFKVQPRFRWYYDRAAKSFHNPGEQPEYAFEELLASFGDKDASVWCELGRCIGILYHETGLLTISTVTLEQENLYENAEKIFVKLFGNPPSPFSNKYSASDLERIETLAEDYLYHDLM